MNRAISRFMILLAIGLVCALYLADLTGMGMYGPDEPRYADIGRTMANTGDFVTPRLWGHPWFEKPAFLYWMTAAGFRLGLGPDLAPRLPVAILSLVFLAFFWWRLSAEWGRREASCATAMLATSVGWLAYSHVAVTDLPMASFFSAAVLLSMRWVSKGERIGLASAAGCLALAALAKGLVPLVLFLPVLAAPVFTGHRDWRRLLDWFRPGPVLAFILIALPWYVLVTLRNGGQFLRVFFIEQHFARFGNPALQHVQPFWFYFPVLVVLLFPWFPLLARPFPKGLREDLRIRILGAVVLFGFVFFSVSVNKLPGYLLPLMPSAFTVLGIGVARAGRPAGLIPVLLLMSVVPLIPELLPGVLHGHGLRDIRIPWTRALILLAGAGGMGLILTRYAAKFAFPAVAAFAGFILLWLQFTSFPVLNNLATTRPLWLAGHPQCAPQASRNVIYGLDYYAGRDLPACPAP